MITLTETIHVFLKFICINNTINYYIFINLFNNLLVGS